MEAQQVGTYPYKLSYHTHSTVMIPYHKLNMKTFLLHMIVLCHSNKNLEEFFINNEFYPKRSQFKIFLIFRKRQESGQKISHFSISWHFLSPLSATLTTQEQLTGQVGCSWKSVIQPYLEPCLKNNTSLRNVH